MTLTIAEQRELRAAAERFGIELLPDHSERFGQYLDLLFQWREHARLVSRRQTRADIIGKHIADSFALVESLRGRRRIADVGSGAGLPGIPVAAVLPPAEVTLIEANRRKANFLREVVRQLGLANVQVVESRVEEARVEHPFDAVVSRAVGAIEDLLENARRLLTHEGIVIAMKGPSVDQELSKSELAKFGFTLARRSPYRLASGESRVLVVLRFT